MSSLQQVREHPYVGAVLDKPGTSIREIPHEAALFTQTAMALWGWATSLRGLRG